METENGVKRTLRARPKYPLSADSKLGHSEKTDPVQETIFLAR
jgi:hypothetical protein